MKKAFHVKGEKKKTLFNCNILSGSGLFTIMSFHRDLLSSSRKYCGYRDYRK